MNVITSKRCCSCHQDVELSGFHKNRSRPDGLGAYCKRCCSEYNRMRNQRPDVKKRNAARMLIYSRARKNKLSADEWVKRTLAAAKYRARSKGVLFELTPEDIKIPSHCPVLGIPLRFGGRSGNKQGPRDDSPSLDRLDSREGYVRDNTVVISWRANKIKGQADPHELRAIADWVERTHPHGWLG